MARGTWDRPWSRLRARGSVLLFDIVLVAYALWCIQFIAVHTNPSWNFLERYPALLIVAAVVAVLWQASGKSLGIAGHRLRFNENNDGGEANTAARMTWGLGTAAFVLALAAPFWFLGWSLLSVSIAAAIIFVAAIFALRVAPNDSVAERVAGVRLQRVREQDAMTEMVPWVRRGVMWSLVAILVLTIWVGVIVTMFDPSKLLDGFSRTKGLLGNLFSPDWSIVSKVIHRMIETVFLALMASALALPFAFAISFFGARNLTRDSIWGRIVYAITRVIMNVSRSIEPLVWAIIFVLWVGAGPFAGMLALTIHSIAALGKLYSEAIESIDDGPVEAMRATGASTVQTIRYGVVPQVIPPFLSFTVYRWDINVRMATILGLIGGGGIGDMLITYSQIGAWSKVGTILFFITLVVWAMDMASGKARELLMSD